MSKAKQILKNVSEGHFTVRSFDQDSTPRTVWFEESVLTEDFCEDYEIESFDAEAAAEEIRAEVRQKIDELGLKLEIGDVEFIEFDSHNLSHSGAHFNVALTGPTNHLVGFLKAQDYDETEILELLGDQ